ncbi:MAG: AAA family ATPase [Treponema sp.]|nr:AAA family ATPase [Treponema sp.]
MFPTGVTKFAQLSVFSDLNRLTDLTLDPAFHDITPEELYRTSFVQR